MKRVLAGCVLAVSTLSFGMLGVAHADSPSSGQSVCSHWSSSPSASSANSRQPDGVVDLSDLSGTVQTPGELQSWFVQTLGLHAEYAGGQVAAVCRP
jgi:hypothetical protein